MARMLARRTTRPSRIADGGAHPRRAPLRPRAGRTAAALCCGLSLALSPLAFGLEPDAARGDLAPRDLASRSLPSGPRDTLPRSADLALVFYDPQNMLPHGFDPFAAEVQSIFRGLGVEASWRVGGGYGGSPIPEVPVILLARDPNKERAGERVMGLVRRDQQPQRAVWLFMDGVRFALGHPTPGSGEADGAMARALARVAAHEIVHAVAPEEPHASEGLMRHSLDKRFLLGRRAPIDARCANSFRARLTDEWKELLVSAPAPPARPMVVP